MKLGLANGALGTLLEVKMNEEGASELLIKFDHLEEPQVIGKTTVCYDVSPTHFVTRTQFPVIVAFGITIHKAQGVTCQNILVDLTNIFESGQA